MKFGCGQERRIGGHEKPLLTGGFSLKDERDTTLVGGHVERSSPTEILSVVQELFLDFIAGLCVTYKCCPKQVISDRGKTAGK